MEWFLKEEKALFIKSTNHKGKKPTLKLRTVHQKTTLKEWKDKSQKQGIFSTEVLQNQWEKGNKLID